MAAPSLPAALPTSLVGSYAQPDWLIDRERLRHRFPPRVRARELWRVDPKYLEQAQDDASLLAIRDQERAGLDIITDGEARRESYSNRFATALEGVDIDNPGTALDRSGHPNPVPRVVGPIARKHPVQVRDVQFLRASTSRPIKITVPGPFTMSQQAQNDFYEGDAELALAYAGAVHDEISDLFAAGADIVQIDEPYMQARPEKAREFGVAALQQALAGVEGTTAEHICFGYAAIIHQRPSVPSITVAWPRDHHGSAADRVRMIGLFGAFTISSFVAEVTASSSFATSSCQAPSTGTRDTHLSLAPMMRGCAVRLGHTGVTATTSSPAPTSDCIASIRALTPDEVTAMRPASTGRCSALTYRASASRSSARPRLCE